MKRFAVLSLFSCFLSAHSDVCCPNASRLTVRHIESGGVGYNTGYTTLEAFLSPGWRECKVTPFLDGRAHVFNNGSWAANGGIGLRAPFQHRLYGLNVYYDYRGTKRYNYNQIGAGLETLGDFIDFRINGYFPVSKTTSPPYNTRFGYFSGHSAILSQKVEFAMTGGNAEVGFHSGKCDSWNFYGALGPYFFAGNKTSNGWGGKVRASLSYRDFIFFEIADSFDNVFHNNVQGQIGISIPLGRKNRDKRTKPLYCQSVQPVERNEIIVLDHKHQYPVAVDPATNTPYYFVFIENTSSSSGTFESPYPSLLLAQDNSSPHDIIYVFPGDGTTRNMDHGISLQANQKLWGASLAYHLQTTKGAITVPAMSTTPPQITNIDFGGNGVTLSTNNEISGMTITGTSYYAITGTDPIGINISSCSFISCGSGSAGVFPILIQSSSNLDAEINNNYFSSNSDGGIYIQLLTGASISNITVNQNRAYNNQHNTGGAAILTIEPHGTIGDCNLVMNGNIFENNDCFGFHITDFNSPQDGSFNSFSGVFKNNTFTGNTTGIVYAVNGDQASFVIKNNNISNNPTGSILVSAGLHGTQIIDDISVMIDSNQIGGCSNMGADAIVINPSSNTISISLINNSISNNSGSGFVAGFNTPSPNAELIVANNIITNNQNTNSNSAGGISFDGFNSLNAVVRNNFFSNNTDGNYIGQFTTPSSTFSTISVLDNELTSGDFFNCKLFGCLTIQKNTSTTSPAYTFINPSSDPAYIVPCNYEAVNTGSFSLTNITPSSDCSGTSCP